MNDEDFASGNEDTQAVVISQGKGHKKNKRSIEL
jgi:hypothetical protein